MSTELHPLSHETYLRERPRRQKRIRIIATLEASCQRETKIPVFNETSYPDTEVVVPEFCLQERA